MVPPPSSPPWAFGSRDGDDDGAGRASTSAPTETPLGAIAAPTATPGTSADAPLSVSDFGATLRARIESTFGARGVWIEGEVRDCTVAKSGHVYFTLRDPHSPDALRCALWRTARVTAAERAAIENGAHLVVHGKASLFAGKSEVQLLVDSVRKAGRGALLEAREKLKAKLDAEGLFAPERKRPLPKDPRIVGIVTSATGAVVHDVRTVAFQRGGARLLLAPAIVQGAAAPESLIAALAAIATVPEVDVIIFGRGGGSAEDLACFDDERVVRAVASCPVPVVSAVGHETDVSLVDFAADARAATPSQAAELCIPASAPRAQALADAKRRLWRGYRERMKTASDQVRDAAEGLIRIADDVRERERLVDEQDTALRGHIDARLRQARLRHEELAARLRAQHPSTRLAAQQTRFHDLDTRVRLAGERLLVAPRDAVRDASNAMPNAMDRRMADAREVLGTAAAKLHALSPLAILSRGYALVTNAAGTAVRGVDDAPVGSAVTIRAANARFEARIEGVRSGDDP